MPNDPVDRTAATEAFEKFEAALQAEPAVNATDGTVEMVVARKGGGVHEVLQKGQVTIEEGLVGDRWHLEKDPARDSQITLMRAGVVRAINDGVLSEKPGDNFQVAFDLSEDALPAGTRLKMGEALFEVTAEPHTGCKLFVERFGKDAMRWVNSKGPPHRRLRGVHCRVVEAGTVCPGDSIERVS